MRDILRSGRRLGRVCGKGESSVCHDWHLAVWSAGVVNVLGGGRWYIWLVGRDIRRGRVPFRKQMCKERGGWWYNDICLLQIIIFSAVGPVYDRDLNGIHTGGCVHFSRPPYLFSAASKTAWRRSFRLLIVIQEKVKQDVAITWSVLLWSSFILPPQTVLIHKTWIWNFAQFIQCIDLSREKVKCER